MEEDYGPESDFVELRETDFIPLHPGIFIERELRRKDVSPEQFAQRCRLDFDEVANVLNHSIQPSDEFLEKAEVVFKEKVLFFRAERDVFIDYSSIVERMPSQRLEK